MYRLFFLFTALGALVAGQKRNCPVPISPQPDGYTCGKFGRVTQPAPITLPKGASPKTIQDCANLCFEPAPRTRPDCVSFGWTNKTSTCALYSRTLFQQKFQAKATSTLFYDLKCLKQTLGTANPTYYLNDNGFEEYNTAIQGGDNTYWSVRPNTVVTRNAASLGPYITPYGSQYMAMYLANLGSCQAPPLARFKSVVRNGRNSFPLGKPMTLTYSYNLFIAQISSSAGNPNLAYYRYNLVTNYAGYPLDNITFQASVADGGTGGQGPNGGWVNRTVAFTLPPDFQQPNPDPSHGVEPITLTMSLYNQKDGPAQEVHSCGNLYVGIDNVLATQTSYTCPDELS